MGDHKMEEGADVMQDAEDINKNQEHESDSVQQEDPHPDGSENQDSSQGTGQEYKTGSSDAEPSKEDGEGSADIENAQQEESAEETEETQEQKEAAPEGKKGFFKKNKKKDKKDEKIEELTDQVKRQMAEFDNFRKRTEKEKSQMYEIGAKSIIEKVLPVVDNFERGLAAVPEDKQEDPFVDGMNKIYKQIMTMLEEVGVQPIEAVGREFDPNLHNAVMQTESDEYESGVVAQEMQKGYMYRDSVVRHSMVSVVS